MAVLKATILLLPVAFAARQNVHLKPEKDAADEVDFKGMEITQSWTGKGSLDMTDAYLNYWNAIPLNSQADFRMAGDLVDLVKLLQARPHLPVECESMWIGQPVSFVVNHAAPKAKDLFLRAFAGGFANMGGIATISVRVADVLKHTAVTELVAMFASNPSSLNLDNVIDGIMRSNTLNNIATEDKKFPGWSMKSIWYWLTGKKTISTLTLKHKPEGEFTPPMVKFKCVKNEFPGKNGTRDRPAFVAIVGDDGEMVPLNAHRLSIFLSALA